MKKGVKFLTTEQRAKIADYLKSGKTRKQAAEEFKVDLSTVGRIANAANVLPNKRRISPEIKEKIALLRGVGYSCGKIAKELGVTRSSAFRFKNYIVPSTNFNVKLVTKTQPEPSKQAEDKTAQIRDVLKQSLREVLQEPEFCAELVSTIINRYVASNLATKQKLESLEKLSGSWKAHAGKLQEQLNALSASMSLK